MVGSAWVRMLRALNAGRKVVLYHDRPVALVARKAVGVCIDCHFAVLGLVASLLTVVLLALRALQEGLPVGHGFEAQSVEGVATVPLKEGRHKIT